MLKKTIFSLVITAIIVFAGCNQSNSPVNTTQSDVLIPLKVGNIWIYQGNFVDTLKSNLLDTIYVKQDTVINGEIWFYCYNVGILTLMTNRNDGVYFMRTDTNNNLIIKMCYKYPANIGDEWTFDINAPSTKITLLSKNDTTTIKGSKFICYKYQWDFNASIPNLNYNTVLEWLCPGKGLIKQEYYFKNNSGKMLLVYSTELLSYELK
jgi:hypothetical protein